jgi:hypothetical protein
VHLTAFAPVAPKSGTPVEAQRLAEGQDLRIEPERSKHGSVSIPICSTDQRVLVLRTGIEIGRAHVAMPGHLDEAGRPPSQEAAARVAMPEGFAYAVSLRMEPGDTMFVTDAPVLAENIHPDCKVLSDGAPDPAPDT